jgi:type I restriction enzyme S subunit
VSFLPYPGYKDSGVAWLGAIPEHWSVGQSRRLFALRNERAQPGDEQLTASQKHGVIPQKIFMEIEDQKVVQVILNPEILKHVEPGDFVISMRSFQGGIEYSKYAGCISSAYVMLIPSPQIYGPFFKYLLKSQTYIQALQSTSNLVRDGQALRYENFTKVELPLVPFAEQKAIAAFLDVTTSKLMSVRNLQRVISGLPDFDEQREIASLLKLGAQKLSQLQVEIERATELLEERRTSLISAAVTGKIDVRQRVREPALADL